MAAGFVLKKTSNGEFLFNLRADNNQVILTSERYKAKASALNGIESVRTNSRDDARFDRRTAKNGSPYFVLTSRNGQVIGQSQTYSSASACEKGISSVVATAPKAPVDDTT